MHSSKSQPSSQATRELSQATRVVHHPALQCEATPLVTPLVMSSAFRLESARQASELSGATHPSSFYSRWGNPTVEVLERLLADLEFGECGLAFASGMAAISTTLLSLLEPGDHLVAGGSLYSATLALLTHDLSARGVEVSLVDPTRPDNIAAAVRDRTRMVYIESPDNPTLRLTDIEAAVTAARRVAAFTVVDNTFATPCNQNPLQLGADVVIHSATKALAGHTDVVAGVVVGSADTLQRIWRQQIRLGGCIDPHAAWLVLRGIKTLALRVERQTANAAALAERLERHSAVARVGYPGLPSHPQHELARRQMHGFGSMIALELENRESARRFAEGLDWIPLAVSLGGVETLVQHPASMTHAKLTDAELQRAGITPGLIRLSVGIEDVADLGRELHRALDRIAS